MNQTQIKFFENKIRSALRRVINAIEANYPEPEKEFTKEERLAQITNGKARFKIEMFSGSECPRYANQLFIFFEFAGEDEVISFNAQRDKEISKAIKKAEREADKLENDFVLEKLKDPTKSIDNFINKYDPAE